LKNNQILTLAKADKSKLVGTVSKGANKVNVN